MCRVWLIVIAKSSARLLSSREILQCFKTSSRDLNTVLSDCYIDQFFSFEKVG